MSDDKRQLIADKRAQIMNILRTEDRPPGYVDLKVSRILPSLRRAEQKIVEGSYGKCDDCNADIGAPRLEAAKGATRCISCQEQYEASLP